MGSKRSLEEHYDVLGVWRGWAGGVLGLIEEVVRRPPRPVPEKMAEV